jgi:endoglucanase
MLFSSTIAAAALLAAKASATIFYAGVAESGGEFGVWSKWFPLWFHSS